MKTKRSTFEIERDLATYRRNMQEAIWKNDFVRIELFARKVAETEQELADARADALFYLQEKNLDPTLVSWGGKMLALVLNMADLSIYYHDMYMAYFKERGFEPVPEWKRKAEAMKKAADDFRAYVSYFFRGKNIDVYNQQMSDLLDVIKDKFFTDRERRHYERYEGK